MASPKYMMACVWGLTFNTNLNNVSYLNVCLTIFLLFLFFETGFLCVALAVLKLTLCRPGWPLTQKSACLCLPSAGIKGVHHHRPASSVSS